MPDNEDIKYSYELDISSLQKGTEKAITLLQRQIDALTGVSNKTKSAEASAKAFEKAWLKASDKVAGAQAKINKSMEAAQRAADKYLAREANQKAPQYVPTNLQKQIEDLTGISSKTKNAEASARAFEKAWLNASNKVTKKSSEVSENIEKIAQDVVPSATNAQSAFAKLSQTIGNMKAPVQQAFAPVTEQLGIMARMIDPNISAKMQSFKAKAQKAFESVGGVLNQVSSAFRRTSDGTDADARSTQALTQRLESLKNIYNRVATASSKLSKGTSSVSSFFDKCSQKLRTFANTLKNATVSTKLLRIALRGLTAERIAEFLKEGIKQSSSYVENLNLFTVAMGQSVEKGNEFVDTMQELYGMDPSNIMRQAGNFYQLATAIEMPDDAATQLSLTMTKAVNDISSLFNVPIETVFENLSSGLQGMSRAVRKYGMDIRATTLQTEALALGITDQVESMSEANRIGLRFIAMMKQASNASGDFAANIETPANQLRIFKEQVTQLGRAIGDFFIAPLRNALQYVNGFIMAIRSILVFIRKVLRIETDFQTRTEGLSSGLDDSADSISGIGSAASKATKKLKGLLAPFDELNVLSQKSSSDSDAGAGISSGVMDPRISQAISDIGYQFEDVEMKANRVRNRILEFLGFEFDGSNILDWHPEKFEANLINKFPQWTQTIQTTFDSWDDIVEGFKSVFSSLGEVFTEAWGKYTETFAALGSDETVANFIGSLSESLESFSKWIDDNKETLSTIVAEIMLLVTTFLLLKSGASILSSISKGFSLLSTAVGLLTSPLGLIVAAFTLLLLTSEDFRIAVVELLEDVWSLLSPVFDLLGEILALVVEDILPEVIGVLGEIGNAIAPILELIGEVLVALKPIVEFIVSVLMVAIRSAVQIVSRLLSGIKDFFHGIAQIISGIVDVIEGIVHGDFNKIGLGLLKIFAGVLNAISGAVEIVINGITGVINTGLRSIWYLVSNFVNGVVGAINGIAKFLGLGSINWRMTVNAPQIPKLTIPRVNPPKKFAQGGIVTGPTYGLIGEAGRDEAVIPLDNSPQMRNLINEIAKAVNGGDRPNNPQPTVIKVFIGNEQLEEYIYNAQNKRALRTNGG